MNKECIRDPAEVWKIHIETEGVNCKDNDNPCSSDIKINFNQWKDISIQKKVQSYINIKLQQNASKILMTSYPINKSYLSKQETVPKIAL